MTNSPQDSSKVSRINEEVLTLFLKALSPDRDEASRHYTSLHLKLVGFFRMKGVSQPERDADTTLDRAALKIAGGALVPEVNRYCFGIARNVARESLRIDSRESSAFLKSLANPVTSPEELVARITNVLQPCLEQLAVEDQKFLQDYCKDIKGRARSVHRRQLAEDMNTTVLALRMRVTRLRTKLADCVKQRSGNIYDV
ncbi:MAG TPA: hypothetical protein VGC91_14135 [Pyrinomonadaceae bacterium]|jgi:hypothetical protein